MYPHRIRLRGPWECHPISRTPATLGLPAPSRVTMPARWADAGLVDFTGRVRFRRKFGYPGTIDAHERVWLTFAGIDGRALIHLNGVEIGRVSGEPSCEYDVTALLQARNELIVELEGGPTGGLWGEVALEVRATAFLRHVAFKQVGEGWGAEGEIVGTSAGPLDLYFLIDGRTAEHQLVQTIDEGRVRFRLEAPGTQGQTAKVDLVNGAVVWYTVEQTLTP